MSDPRIKSMREAFNMTKQRCYNPKCKDYKYYGGRGITICDRWLEAFDNFLNDMGIRPDGMTLERVDNDGPYSPENCVWATRARQGQNTRLAKLVTHRGETHTIAEWERRMGWKPGTLKARLGPLGYTVDQAFSKPVKCGGLLESRAYPPRKKPDMSRVPRGLDSPHTAFTADEVEEIRILVSEGLSRSLIARAYGVTTTTISHAADGKGAYSAA